MFLNTFVSSFLEFLLWMPVEVLQGSIYRWIQFIQEEKEKKTGQSAHIRDNSTFPSNVIVNYLVDRSKDQ